MELTTPIGEIFQVDVFGSEGAMKAALLIHDWWGVLEYNHQWASELAKRGYRTMVIDLYDGHHPVDSKAAGEYMRSLNQEVLNRKLQTALLALRATPRKVAVLGWSFGGSQAQLVALQYPELVDATIFFYCRNVLNKHNAGIIRGPVLAFFSETERTWPDKQAELEYAMSEAGKTFELHSYDADHGFVNPERSRYDSEAAEESWRVTVAFLEKHLGTF